MDGGLNTYMENKLPARQTGFSHKFWNLEKVLNLQNAFQGLEEVMNLVKFVKNKLKGLEFQQTVLKKLCKNLKNQMHVFVTDMQIYTST